MLAKFFINRPRFAIVISCILIISGTLCALSLPLKQYPDVAPPQIMIFANYLGADAETIMNTVGVPLEEAINGIENMIYMTSSSNNDGTYALTITFKTGTDTDIALVKVQNKIQQVSSQLPQSVVAMGIRVSVLFSNMLGFIALISPNETRDSLFLSDYAATDVLNKFKRIPGIGEVTLMGYRYGVRIWLNPEALYSLGLSAFDVRNAITNQNVQAAIGSVGMSPVQGEGAPIVYSLMSKGRLSTVEEFENIIVKRNAEGAFVKLKDVARVEIGSESYGTDSMFLGRPCTLMMLSQGANANALEVMDGVKKAIEEMKPTMPSDSEFIVVYDSTDFVKISFKEIVETLIITFILVVFVCYLFLQNWKVTLVPAVAIPVSLMATFISLAVLGYSINTFTLFGLVLVIGTVVDDAIVVVERVLFVMNRDKVKAPQATEQAMKDISGSMIATTLVFLAIFVPVSFMSGISGEIYKQIGVTMSFAVVCSTTVAFTLSPAMCANMFTNIKPKTRGPLAWFNKLVEISTNGFVKVSILIAKSFTVLLISLGIVCAVSWYIMEISPTEFIPSEDQGSIMGSIQLPEGSPMGKMKNILTSFLLETANIKGVQNNIGIMGYSFLGGTGENVGSISFTLSHWDERTTDDLKPSNILNQVSKIAEKYPEAVFSLFEPGGIPGLSLSNGLDLRLQATQRFDPVELERVMKEFVNKLNASPEVLYAFSGYTANTPHILVEIDRLKSESMGISAATIFNTLLNYFGTVYVSDTNLGTKVNKVFIQGDWDFRNSVEDLKKIHIMNDWGEQVSVHSLISFREVSAPRSITRYNLYPAASITVILAPGYSSGQGIELIQNLSKTLPQGYAYEWAGQTYQEIQEGGQFALIIISASIFVFLFLVAQYESWSLPVAVMLSLPMAVLGALAGVKIMNITISVYTQLGLLLLVGLASKNAILIIEFAKEQREKEKLLIIDSAAKAARERFRSVLMTAFTCVLGAMPMLFASGAGAKSRIHVGTTMFFGMTVATVFGVLLIPGLFVFMQTLREKLKVFLHRLFKGDDEDE